MSHYCDVTPKAPRGRNNSAEGSGIARQRWFDFLSELDSETLDRSGYLRIVPDDWGRSDQDDHNGNVVTKHVKEFSELVGFWIAWHQAGGFDLLEERGWTRATIYRKIKRFREFFGNHPDDHDFDWIQLDLTKAWNDDLAEMFEFRADPE